MDYTISSLDQFPIELLHIIFDYFSADEILYSFFNINNHINNIIYTYQSYRFNFQSIKKSDFDNVCQIIKPNQVISLRLSDDSNTPDQSQLFFSSFFLEQFIRLRSLTLFDVDFAALKSTITKLNKLNQLRSLSIYCDNINQKYLQRKVHDFFPGHRTKFVLLTIPSKILIQLNQLNLGFGLHIEDPCQSINLRYLTLEKYYIENLQTILSKMSQLIYMNISLEIGTSNISHICFPSSLRWLRLKINDSSITMNEIECFLSYLPDLRRLELDLRGEIDLVDGHRWKILSKDLIKFNFKFHVNINNIDPILDLFHTSYWLLNKQWYVTYDNHCLFTIPYFASTCAHIPYHPPINSTISNKKILYDHIKSITMLESESPMLHRFPNCEELSVMCRIDFQFFSSTNNLSRMKHLKLKSLDDIHLFLMHLNSMPSLSKLSINGNLTEDFIENRKNYRTKQIRMLEIETSTKDLSYIIEGLIFLFPQIESLRFSTLHLRKDLIRLIDGFKYLSNALFIIKYSSNNIDQKWFIKPKLSINGVRRLTNESFTCRFNRLLTDNSSYEINLWIGKQIQKSWWTIHFPLRQGYYWYRLTYKFFRHPLIITIRNIYRKLISNKNVENILQRLRNSRYYFVHMKIIFFVLISIFIIIITYDCPLIRFCFSIICNLYMLFPKLQRLPFKSIPKTFRNITEIISSSFRKPHFY